MRRFVRCPMILILKGDHRGRAYDDEMYRKAIDDLLDAWLRGPVVVKRRAVGR